MDNKILKSSWAIAFTVASIWFGTHVGGGFASGNQVVGYFSQFGSLGSLLFPIISMGLLAFVMSIYLKFARLNGFDNYNGAAYDLALWVAYYNFLRPHKTMGYKVLNAVPMIQNAGVMPGQWQIMIYLGQKVMLEQQKTAAEHVCS